MVHGVSKAIANGETGWECDLGVLQAGDCTGIWWLKLLPALAGAIVLRFMAVIFSKQSSVERDHCDDVFECVGCRRKEEVQSEVDLRSAQPLCFMLNRGSSHTCHLSWSDTGVDPGHK